MITATKSKKFSDMTLITPIESADQMKEFFEIQKVEYFSIPILYPLSYKDAEKLSLK